MMISPVETRYKVEELERFLSQESFIFAMLEYERVYLTTLMEFIGKKEKIGEVNKRFKSMEQDSGFLKQVRDEEKKTKHDVRALVNVIQLYLPDDLRSYVHLGITSYDVVDSVKALMYKKAFTEVIIPDMVILERRLIELAEEHADTIQMGRTHGQHAVPITFGFAVANYVSRFGNSIERHIQAVSELNGKCSGAVGAYNALSLLVGDPVRLEKKVLMKLGLYAEEISNQIVQPERFTRLVSECVVAFGILNDFANDMRQLQRTEISEVCEAVESEQVGSSTMPHKRNPISWENVCSLYRVALGYALTSFLNQESEHQRDLRNSASQRFYSEFFMLFDYAIRRMIYGIKRLQVSTERMKSNANLSSSFIAEPLYVLLAKKGDAEAHKKVQEAVRAGKLDALISHLPEEERNFIVRIKEDSSHYIGLSPELTKKVCTRWREKLNTSPICFYAKKSF